MLPIRFASGFSRASDPAEVANEVAHALHEGLTGTPPDLALAFISGHYTDAEAVAQALHASLGAKLCLGCTAESLITRDQEIEQEEAVSVVAASLPNVDLVGFAVSGDDWPEILSDPALFRNRLGVDFNPKLFILLADPFSSPMDDVLELFNAAYPGVPVVGGMASAANAVQARDGDPAFTDLLFTAQTEFHRLNGGAVGVALAGEIEIDVIVSQGCRPVGEPLLVTRADRNILMSLENGSPMQRLQDLFEELPAQDRELLRNGVYLGRAIDSTQEDLGRGDFLIRGLMGADPDQGFLAVGDYIHPGERVQFHLHDAHTATEDLELLLLPQTLQEPPVGAFLFSCNGRGTRLYDHPNGDIETVQQFLNDAPLAGFFCAGEIGPVGGRNFLHSQTASLVIFRPTSTS